MNTVSKQDGVYPRTPSALAQQYDFGKVFDEITGIKLTIEEQEALMEAELSLKLGYDDNDQIVSMLNASANIITIRGNRLTIESDHFDVTADGTVYARAGEIGGCIIKDGVLQIKAINIVDQLTADQIDTQQFDKRVSEVETSLTIVSGQIESKVSQTDFDALGNTVSTHETKITQLPDQILSEISATYATQDALNTGIASAESKITQTASEIRSEVSVTYATKDEIPDTEDIKDRLIRAESAITQMPNEILSEVSATYATQAGLKETNTRIDQQDDKIDLKVSQTDFDDLGERVSETESNITALSGEISAKVSYTEFNALGDELASVQGELSLKIDETNLVSTLNATADVISINYDQLILNGENVSFSDGVMHLLELYVGDGWSNHLEVDSTGMRLSSFYVRDSYDVVTGHSTYLGVDNLYCAYASAGGWTFDTNSATLTTADGYLTFGIGGVFGTATNGHTILWSDLYNLVNS